MHLFTLNLTQHGPALAAACQPLVHVTAELAVTVEGTVRDSRVSLTLSSQARSQDTVVCVTFVGQLSSLGAAWGLEAMVWSMN